VVAAQPQQHQPSLDDRSWSFYLVNGYIEAKSKQLFSLFKGGYTSVLNLITYLDVFLFLLKHEVIQPLGRVHVYLVVCEQLLKVLEEEVQKFDHQID
jgi:hypothetical protein